MKRGSDAVVLRDRSGLRADTFDVDVDGIRNRIRCVWGVDVYPRVRFEVARRSRQEGYGKGSCWRCPIASPVIRKDKQASHRRHHLAAVRAFLVAVLLAAGAVIAAIAVGRPDRLLAFRVTLTIRPLCDCREQDAARHVQLDGQGRAKPQDHVPRRAGGRQGHVRVAHRSHARHPDHLDGRPRALRDQEQHGARGQDQGARRWRLLLELPALVDMAFDGRTTTTAARWCRTRSSWLWCGRATGEREAC